MRIGIVIGIGVGAYLVYRAWLDKQAVGPDLTHVPGESGVHISERALVSEEAEPWVADLGADFRG